MGPTRMARRAGMKEAQRATAQSRIVTVKKVSASVFAPGGPRSKSFLLRATTWPGGLP